MDHHAPLVDGSGSDRLLIKSQIVNHPLYPHLLSAFLDCHKVGADPDRISFLEEIGHQRPHLLQTYPPPRAPHDPQLDHFMESYCRVLHRYKEELSRPFFEASFFLSSMQSKLTSLCGNATFSIPSSPPLPDEASGSNEKEKGMNTCGDAEAGGEGNGDGECDGWGFAGGEQKLREMLLRKYSGYLSSFRKELMKKKKKNKLPKEARMALLQWWNSHYRWPYPTEEEKVKLSEVTGLDQKQINNWFINQRKRHWKPSEDMRVSLMEGVTGGDIN